MDSFDDRSISTGEINMGTFTKIEPCRVDELGIVVCVVCDVAVENHDCLCSIKAYDNLEV